MENKETLEEAVVNSWLDYEHVEGCLYSTSYKNGFKAGAKYQAEKMYTKDDVLKAGKIGEINHHDYKHIVSLLDEAKKINNGK